MEWNCLNYEWMTNYKCTNWMRINWNEIDSVKLNDIYGMELKDFWGFFELQIDDFSRFCENFSGYFNSF